MKAAQLMRDETDKDLISKTANCGAQGVSLLKAVFCGMSTMFHTLFFFLSQTHNAAESSGSVQIIHLTELESQVISFLRKIY